MKQTNLTYLIALLIAVSAVPCLAGFVSGNSELIYSGVVFNPIDGYSYLAKMAIGQSEDWLFTLPFTPNPGEGRLLYPFYIAAGQLQRFFPVPSSIWFNILRLAAYGFLLWTISRLVQTVFQKDSDQRSVYFLVIGAGGGLGWLLLPIGKFGADFWVAEAYPLLSGLVNPHFPLSLGLAVGALLLLSNDSYPGRTILAGLCGLFLSILSPFGFVVMAAVLTLSWAWEKLEKSHTSPLGVLVFILSGLPYSVYQYWAVQSTPQLAAWTAQNQTPSPVLWDILLAFSPWMILVAAGAKSLYFRRDSRIIRKLLVWMVVGLLLTVVPFNLQRRFLFGLYIPIAVLGLVALPGFAERINFSIRRLGMICLMLSLITPLFLLTMTVFAPLNHNPLYFYRSDELEAIEWLSTQGVQPATVLASSETGMLIPSVKRVRVLYGHPFESIDAEESKQAVEKFFTGRMDENEAKDLLFNNRINWILIGPRERQSGEPQLIRSVEPDKQFGQISVYSVDLLMDHD